MKYKAGIRQLTAAVAIAIGGAQAGCAQELTKPVVQPAPAPAAAQPASAAVSASAVSGIAVTTAPALASDAPTAEEAAQNARGNVAEVQQLIQAGQLTEMRTTYNGSYGATLLLNPNDMTYYVALFQQKTFWRVIKTTDDARAEAIFHGFVGQTERLAQVELRRVKLEGQKARTEELLRLAQDRESRLKADLDVAQRQRAVVATQQQRERAQADSLQAQDAQERQKLAALQRQVRKLEIDVDSGGLPSRRR